MAVILKASNISKTFSNDVKVVKPTSFEIEKGEIYVIKGKSGSGKSLGFVFQSFHLIPELSVKENIELPLIFNSLNNNKLNIKDMAGKLEIENLLDKKPSQLSGGEQQRVAIARSLITSPEIIFADEPTGNLDHKTTRKIIDILCELSEVYRIAMVIVTHEKNLIKIPHNLFIMQEGELEVEYRSV